MSFEDNFEKLKSGGKPVKKSFLNLEKAIEFGEYDPQFLAGFPEWHELDRHAQFRLINQAIDNRRKHLLSQWADVSNVLDFRNKPHLNEALKNIEAQWKKVEIDRERLLVEYSK